MAAVRENLGVTDQALLTEVYLNLSQQVHPLVLGQIFRTLSQIRSLAGKLLENQVQEEDKRKEIINFLCSDSGSHDYTINRREAQKMGLNIEKPTSHLYSMLKILYESINDELMLQKPYNIVDSIGLKQELSYVIPRCLIESADAGSHQFISKGVLRNVVTHNDGVQQHMQVQDHREFEGWEKVA